MDETIIKTTNDSTEVVNEPEKSVSSEVNDVEWVAPKTKEEFDSIIKSSNNKAMTQLLHDLGVKSVKEFKEYKKSVDDEKSTYDNLIKERDSFKEKYNELEKNLNDTKESLIINKLGIPDEYRDDILEIAKKGITDDIDLEASLTNLLNTRYSFIKTTNNNRNSFGVEKSNNKNNEMSGVMRAFLENNPDLKNQFK